MARAIADWWDAVELWLTQLPFPLQVVLAIVVLLPAAWGGAAAFDRLWDLAAACLARRGGRTSDDPAAENRPSDGAAVKR